MHLAHNSIQFSNTYSIEMFASWPTLVQRWISVWIRSPNCCGDISLASAPSPAMNFNISGEVSVLLIAALSWLTTSDGMPAWTTLPHHDDKSKPERPDSANVGTSGRICARLSLVTASGLT